MHGIGQKKTFPIKRRFFNDMQIRNYFPFIASFIDLGLVVDPPF